MLKKFLAKYGYKTLKRIQNLTIRRNLDYIDKQLLYLDISSVVLLGLA